MLSRLVSFLAPIEKCLSKFLEVFCVILLTLIIIDVSVAVFCRYVIVMPLLFAENLAKYLFIWFSFAGATLAFRQGSHVSVEFFSTFVNSHNFLHLITKCFILIIGSIFFILIIYYGWRFAWKSRFVTDPFVFGISMIYTYSSVCVCALLMLMEFVFQNLKLLSYRYGINQ